MTALEEEIWEQVIAVNLKGIYLGCKYAIPEIVPAGGVIMNASSLAGLLGVGNVHAYTAAKGGVISLTPAIARAYAKQPVRCNLICSGAVDTPLMAPVLHGATPKLREGFERGHPLGRLGTHRRTLWRWRYTSPPMSRCGGPVRCAPLMVGSRRNERRPLDEIRSF